MPFGREFCEAVLPFADEASAVEDEDADDEPVDGGA
jgi:hypothetical protein